MSSKKDLDLGFLEVAPSWCLSSRFFPSKVGGSPAWLCPEILPDLSCPVCLSRARMTFLCQIYAPLESSSSTFHRTVFVFLCRSPECHVQEEGRPLPFRVFRSQLPRDNAYYPREPPVEQESWRTDLRTEKYTTLCR